MPATMGEPGYGAPPTNATQSAGGSSTPYDAPPSGAIQSGEDYAGAQDAYNRALIRFNQQRTGLLQQYGYKGTVDPKTGMITNVGVDEGNVHGALQELLGRQSNEDDQATWAAEDRGLHGGLANQAQSALHYQHGGETGALGQQLFGGLSDLNSQQQDAQGTLNDALWQLAHQDTSAAVDSGDYNPSDYTDDPVAAPPGAKTKAPARGLASARGRIPQKTAAALVARATRAGQPTSEHGAGSLGNPVVKKAPAKKPASKPYGGRH